MHSMYVDLEPGGWILDMYFFFVDSMLLIFEICSKVKRRFSSAMDLCEVPITDWRGGLQLILTRL